MTNIADDFLTAGEQSAYQNKVSGAEMEYKAVLGALDDSLDIEAIKTAVVTDGVNFKQISYTDNGDNIAILMPDGGTVTHHSAITASVTEAATQEVDCRDYTKVRIECEVSAIVSGNWALSLLGSEASGGTFGGIYQDVAGTQTLIELLPLPANGKKIFTINRPPKFIKVVPTRTTDGTLTVKVTPCF